MNKFGFSKDTLIRARRLFGDRPAPGRIRISVTTLGIISESLKTKWSRHAFELYDWKYKNLKLKYRFEINREGLESVWIPIRVLYDKGLTYSERLAIIWSRSLNELKGRTLIQREVEEASGISERTIRKAKNKHPEFFGQVPA